LVRPSRVRVRGKVGWTSVKREREGLRKGRGGTRGVSLGEKHASGTI